MIRKTIFLAVTAILVLMIAVPVFGQEVTYTVKPGDSMWKIAVKYQVGLDELIAKNPQIKNPALIYPGQKITIPTIEKSIREQEKEVIRLVNIERSKRGLETLSENWQLSRVARFKSQDMINKRYFSHYSPTYGSPFKMMEDFGLKYSAAGENIAMGYRTPQEVMQGWMNSPGHRNNILSPSFSQIGVGLAVDKYGRKYWTQMFIRPTRW